MFLLRHLHYYNQNSDAHTMSSFYIIHIQGEDVYTPGAIHTLSSVIKITGKVT